MKIGYIQEINLEMNPHIKERFRFKEASFTVGGVKPLDLSMGI